jgi:hypothetical protein
MEINGFQVFFGQSPGKAVVRGPGQFVQITSRDGCVHDFMLEDAVELARVCTGFESPNVWVKLRSFWGDNSSGSALARVQVLLGDPLRDPRSFDWSPTTGHGRGLSSRSM